MQRAFFGVDGGGTRSRLLITDTEGNELGRKEGGCTNRYAVGFKVAVQNLKDLLHELSAYDCQGLCIASAGLGREAEKEELKNALDLTVPLLLCSDAEALLVGGLEKLEGVCLICGTGSIALARDAEGHTLRSGGFGWRLGDEGSAWWQGWQAVSRSLRSSEGRDKQTTMLPAICEKLGVKTKETLITLMNGDTLSKSQIGELSPIVTYFASDGDELALDIVKQAIDELTLLVDSLFNRMPSMKCRDVVVAGGVLEHDVYLRKLLQERWEKRYRMVLPKGSALEGALMLARTL